MQRVRDEELPVQSSQRGLRVSAEFSVVEADDGDVLRIRESSFVDEQPIAPITAVRSFEASTAVRPPPELRIRCIAA